MYRGITGNYRIENLDKYVGKLLNPPLIGFKSLLECRAMKILDLSDTYKYWGYEIITIPYKMFGATHKYHVDFYVENMDGTKELWEVKPGNIVNRDYTTNVELIEQYQKNEIKWKYAKAWCEARNIKFVIMIE